MRLPPDKVDDFLAALRRRMMDAQDVTLRSSTGRHYYYRNDRALTWEPNGTCTITINFNGGVRDTGETHER